MQVHTNIVERLKVILRRAQVTRSTAYGIMGAGWGFLAGPVTLILIAKLFSPEVQGYYYTFSSVLALNILFELGFSNIVKYFAGHEWAKLSFDINGRIVGDADALSRLISLGRASFRWYLMGGVIVAFGIGMGGYVFFSQSPAAGVIWVAPWLALSLLSGINMALIPVWSLLEGCNQVSQVYFFRLIGSILVTLAIWSSVSLGAGLWTASISLLILLIWSAVYLMRRYRHFIGSFFSRPTGPCINWWGEIWQVQWRTAISYLSGYFSSYIFTPLLFHFNGSVVAGQFGMSMTLAGAVGSIATMWSTPRGPQFAMMLARKEYKAIDRLLYRIFVIALGVLITGSLAVWLLVYGLNMLDHPFATRLLPLLPMALLLFGNVVANALHPTGIYVRAHKKEPYAAISVASGVLIGLFSLALVRRFGAVGLTGAYLGVNLILFPWGLAIFYRCRHKWRVATEY